MLRKMQWNVVMEELGFGGSLRKGDEGSSLSRVTSEIRPIYELRAMFSHLFQLAPMLPKTPFIWASISVSGVSFSVSTSSTHPGS